MKKVSRPTNSPALVGQPTASEAIAVISTVAGFVANAEQMALKAKLVVQAKEEGGSPLSTLNSHDAVEKAAGFSVPTAWTANPLFMTWLRDGDEGLAKAELLYQRCMDKALEVVSDVTLSDKDLAALLKISSELSGRVSKGGPAGRTMKQIGAVGVPTAASREELKKQLHDWAISEGYTPPSK